MEDFEILIIIMVVVGIAFGAIIGISTFVERTEADDFWECIEKEGSVDWCINNFA